MKALNIVKPNLDGYNINDRQNCTVVALSAVSPLNYDEANQIATKAGRKQGRKFHSFKLIEQFNGENLPYRFEEVLISPITLGKFCETFSTGRYYARKKGHAFAVIDGTVVNSYNLGSRIKVLRAWKLVEK